MPQEYGLGRGLASLIPQRKPQGSTQKDDETQKEEKKEGLGAIQVDENFKFDKKKYESWGSKTSKGGVSNESQESQSVSQKTSSVDSGKSNESLNVSHEIREVEVEKIRANPFQPRTNFDESKLEELSQSIKKHGVIQPLIVTKKGEEFELIAGERRLQASKKAGMQKVPVVIKDVDDKEKMEWAIIENIQRHDLNPIEEARAYKRLMEESDLHQDEVAEKMGKSRSLVANKIRLLELPMEVKKALIEGKITEGHAKAILSVSDNEKRKGLLEIILKDNLTVRQAETRSGEIEVKKHKRKVVSDPYIKDIEDRLTESLGTKVKIKKTGDKGGSIVIDYYSNEELKGIMDNIAPRDLLQRK